MSANRQGLLLDLGLRDYKIAWDLQRELVEKRAKDEISDVLILVEHPHVITLGRGSHIGAMQLDGIPWYAVERGGGVTYHGPGQLVGYPILKLGGRGAASKRDLHKYLRDLEEVLIRALSDFGICAERREGLTGVWMAGSPPQKKIASIGVAVRRWVTYHGFALNVNTDLNFFKRINPCGLDGAIMTSMAQQLQQPIEMRSVKESVKCRLEEVFDIQFVRGVKGSCNG